MIKEEIQGKGEVREKNKLLEEATGWAEERDRTFKEKLPELEPEGPEMSEIFGSESIKRKEWIGC